MTVRSVAGVIIGIVASAVLLLAAWQLGGSGPGLGKFSDASLSSSNAKRSGVLLKKLTTESEVAYAEFEVSDIWLEEIVERWESVPLRKRSIGARLCIKVEFKGHRGKKIELRPTTDDSRLFAKGSVMGIVRATGVRDGSVESRSVVVFREISPESVTTLPCSVSLFVVTEKGDEIETDLEICEPVPAGLGQDRQ